jgi:hypothetical protein
VGTPDRLARSQPRRPRPSDLLDDATTARITVATDAEDAAAAAEIASCAVSRALHATDLGALYPRAIEVELVNTNEPVAA